METPNTFGSDSVESTLENIDTNTPLGGSVQASEPSEQRTVADFYRGIAEQVTDDTPDQIVEHSQELHDLDTKQQEIDEQQQDVGFFDIKTKIGLNKEQREVSTQQRDVTQKLQDLKSPAEELLDVSTSSDVEVARTLDPKRLEELAKANEPLYGQEASVRVADLTSEQVAERRQKVEKQREARMQGEGYTMPLPEDTRTQYQKELDIIKQTQEAERKVETETVEVLSSRLLSHLNVINEKERMSMKPDGELGLWETDPEVIKTFAELAYRGREDSILATDVAEGSAALRNKAEIIKQGQDPETLSGIEYDREKYARYIESKADEVDSLEREVLSMITTFQMAKDVCEKAGVESVSPDVFSKTMERISKRWEYDKDKYREDSIVFHYSAQGSEYRRSVEHVEQKVISSMYDISGLPHSFGSIPEGIAQDIADSTGKWVQDLGEGDIHAIFAYFNVAVREGYKRVSYSNLTQGLELTLRHILANTHIDGVLESNIGEKLAKITLGSQGQELVLPPGTFMELIIDPYAKQLLQAGNFDVHYDIEDKRKERN